MGANLTIENDTITIYDKCIIVLNWHALNVVQNIGCIYKKSKIVRNANMAGIWRIKKKK
jgi:hypothetical protein